MYIKNRRVRINKYSLAIFIALIILILDILVITNNEINHYRHQNFINDQGLAINSNYHPTTAKAPANVINSYSVPANDPKYIIIRKLNIDARIIKVGLTGSNQINTPINSYDTAWYSGSAQPGSPGTMFIDGHVDGWYVPGVFYYLKNLVPGDVIDIVTGNNTTYSYVVKQLKTYSASNVNMNQVLSSISPGVSALNLMTCAGGLINNNTDFNQRLVVFSLLQK